MKRFGNLYQKIISLDNLHLAEKKARRGKSNQYGVKRFDLNKDKNLLSLHHILLNNKFKTSRYKVFTLYEKKERIIYKLPYYPDRIVHHAILNILEPVFVSTFTKDVYNCIKNRGIYKALNQIKLDLKDGTNTKYVLKLDIQKFYPNIDHEILKYLLKKKFKDQRLLDLLFEIIDSADGLPIGNYLSQYLANFYLAYFDHWLKETKKVKYYYRYCDDIVIFGATKEELHLLLNEIRVYLYNNLKLKLKSNYQVFPLESRGLDFLGYVFYHDYIRLRKSIKLDFIKMLRYTRNNKSIVSYFGWLKHGNCINLSNKYLK